MMLILQFSQANERNQAGLGGYHDRYDNHHQYAYDHDHDQHSYPPESIDGIPAATVYTDSEEDNVSAITETVGMWKIVNRLERRRHQLERRRKDDSPVVKSLRRKIPVIFTVSRPLDLPCSDAVLA